MNNIDTLLIQKPSAWSGHFEFAEWLITKVKPKIFVELGSHWGHSYFSFCKAVRSQTIRTKCYAVDSWIGDNHAGIYNHEVYDSFNAINDEHFSKFSSPLKMNFDDALAYFDNNSIGLLHIDGHHSYKSVRHDFETWLPKLTCNSIILFHDIVVKNDDFGVWKLWNELKQEYPNHMEFTHSNGLGVLSLSKLPQKLSDWISDADPREIEEFIIKGKCFELEKNLQEVMGKLQDQLVKNEIIESELRQITSSWWWRLNFPVRVIQQFFAHK